MEAQRNLGKLNFYLSAVDELLRHEHDNPPVGGAFTVSAIALAHSA